VRDRVSGRTAPGSIMSAMTHVRSVLTIGVASAMVLGLAAPSARAQSVSMVMPASGAAADAWKALDAGQLREAEDRFTRARASSPDDTAVLLGSAVVARRLGQGADAQQWLVRALQIDPALTAASVLLASLAREFGDLDAALRVYEAALVRVPDNAELIAGADACRAELARLTRWPGDLGGHARIFFEGPVDDATARLALEAVARARQSVVSMLRMTPPDLVTVVLATSAAPPRSATVVPEWSTSQYDGRIRMQVRPPVKDRAEFTRMLVHEYAHAALRGVAPAGVPTWINEGLATWLEPDGVTRAERELRSAGVLLPWPRLQESFASLPPALVTPAYAQSALGVGLLIARAGLPALFALMRDLAAGEPFDSALRTRTGLSFESFQAEFLASLRGR
jgi:hypothetical protein